MLTLRKANDRGHADHGWLDSHHTFSFSGYHDPAFMGFRGLRVINEDRVAAGQGFGKHGHRDMEIISYVLEGALEHRDSLGNGEVLRPGELQRMSAGSGVEHSEFNPSATDAAHFYQIWLLPNERGVTPSYEQKSLAGFSAQNGLRLVASGDGALGSMRIHADAKLFVGQLSEEQTVEYPLGLSRHAWLQVAHGSLQLSESNDDAANRSLDLQAGDGVAISDAGKLILKSRGSSEILLFDLA